jgi:hypothetical protein
MRSVIFIVLCIPVLLLGQGVRNDSLWLPFQPFIGQWTGTGGGEPGVGKYERTYQYVLGKNFVEVRNISKYPPSERQPQGEVHEDVGYFSYDQVNQQFRLRQFHVEGFVNDYVLDSITPDKRTIVFVTEAIENLPPGWKARETYRILDQNRMMEVFELAEPGKEYVEYSKVEFSRRR